MRERSKVKEKDLMGYIEPEFKKERKLIIHESKQGYDKLSLYKKGGCLIFEVSCDGVGFIVKISKKELCDFIGVSCNRLV